jgi:hypothetical protein
MVQGLPWTADIRTGDQDIKNRIENIICDYAVLSLQQCRPIFETNEH